ncbi:hypothetical protein CAPTEDRAFT_198699 [Capitella teleta]|uniref:Protein-cysteine N-palmitoyltransferase Rasp n=1 Tax=Capitella teleta TaxID=283909 RepID=R7V2W0_CAPTE|nr:hypothetical protein CAPTEDRAFT_198699 [Capitella teleta]|eukprot:ELU12899.1 hypothetical protein CAPTEDRAFT_198699 [Capitella teleta]
MVNQNGHRETGNDQRAEEEEVSEPSKASKIRLYYSGPVPLPRWETWMYISGWVGAVSFCYYAVYEASKQYANEFDRSSFVDGWKILGGRKDVSNFEWIFWSTLFFQLWKIIAGHMLIGQLCRLSPDLNRWRGDIFLVYGVCALTLLIGPWACGVFVVQSLLFYAASLSCNSICIWILSIALIFINNNRTINEKMENLNWDKNFRHGYFMITADFAMNIIRGTGAALSLAESKSWLSKGHFACVKDVLLYMFYIPLFFCGPLVNFEDFCKQMSKPVVPFSREVKTSMIKRLLRIVIWWFVINIFLHLFHITALQKSHHVMSRLRLWALAGVGFCQGQFFMQKYFIMFGLPSLIASLDDIIAPSFPKCISRIYLFSEMWKSFDHGLYNFIKSHIYIPLGGSRKGAFRQLLASFLCFAFIYLWHGATRSLLFWALLNHAGIVAEVLGTKLTQMKFVQQMEEEYLGLRNSRRIRALFGIPMFCLSAMATFYFFGGSFMAQTIYRRLLFEGFPLSNLALVIFVYCLVQTSMEVQIWEAKKAGQKSL